MDKKLLAKLIAGVFGTAPFVASLSEQALAAGTDIATAPLANRRSSDIKPNIMLVLDDSGSMMLDFMPQSVSSNDPFGPGYRNYLCNTVYYNPTPSSPTVALSPYLVPRTDTGADLNSGTPASFTAAYDNGYWNYDQIGHDNSNAPRMTNLGTDQGYGGYYDTAIDPNPGKLAARSGQAAYYWQYLGTDTASVTPTSAVCTLPGIAAFAGNFSDKSGICSTLASAPYDATYTTGKLVASSTTTSPTDANCSGGKLIWKKILVSATSGPGGTDETLRFANWYSYYRNRMQMTKSAIGRAFLPLIGKKKYRAGFITIAPDQLEGNAPTEVPPSYHSVYSYTAGNPENSKFLEIRNFDTEDTSTNQPYRWFRTLYAQRPNGQTPLREGLARVGRYYAGKNDGPNAGMIPTSTADPVQYACQQNYTILTTDGYWDSPTTSPGGFKLDYTVAMDNQDGDITETVSYVDDKGITRTVGIGARPIYDGTVTLTRTTTDAENLYQRVGCTYQLQSTQQILQSTVQPLQSTRQVFGWTRQVIGSTAQVIRNRRQEFYSTQQRFTWNALQFGSTLQKFQRTYQENALTSQLTTYDLWVTKDTRQLLSSTTQQFYRTITQQPVTRQRWTNDINVNKNTSQDWRYLRQLQSGTGQQFSRTEQRFASTTRRFVSTTQQQARTTQIMRCNPDLTNCNTPVQVGGTNNEFFAYTTLTVGWAGAASCTAGTNTGTWVTTTCSTVNSGPTAISSVCTASTDTSTWVTTTCSTLTTGPTATSAAACTVSTDTSTWITSSCSTSTVAFASIASCTASTNTGTWVTTVCSTSTVAATGVTSCAASTNSSTWVTTTCSTVSSSSTLATCAATNASAGNGWLTTTCSTSTTSAAIAAGSCTATTTAQWMTTTCPTTVTSLSSVLSCAASTNTSTWVTTTCSTSTATLAAVSLCVDVPASSGNNWVHTACSTFTSAYSTVASCTASTNTSTWVTTTCSISTTTTVPTPTCVAGTGASPWVTTTCSTVTTGTSNVAAATCTASTNTTSWLTTMCSTTTTAITIVPSTCVPAAGSLANNWVTTVCATVTATIPTSTCVAAAASAGNSWIATTCATNITGFTSINACTPINASAGNNWVTTTCSTSTTGPTSVTSCATTTNANWVTTTCSTSTSATASISSCTVSTNAGTWVTTLCSTSNAGPSSIVSCVSTTNASWVTTTCSVSTSSTSLAAASCANTVDASWLTTTCSTSTTGPTGAASCTASTNGSTWVTTTCTTSVSSTSAAVSSCSASTDTGNWVTTVCSTTSTGPTGISACTPGTNGTTWVTTTCSTSTTTDVPVASCTATTNASWVTVTCDTTSSPSNTANVIMQSCTPTAAGSGNNYVSTSCVPVAGQQNQYQTRTKSDIERFSNLQSIGTVPGSWSGYSAWTTMAPYCQPTAGLPALPTDGRPGATDPTTPARTTFDATCSGWPCVHDDSTVVGGSSNSLADVAQYYYKTDLRPSSGAGYTAGYNGADVSANKVPSSATDTTEGDAAVWQHMTTFTMGLGVSGNVTYNKDYKTKPIGSFMASSGTNPVTGVTSPAGTPLEPFQLIRCQDAANAALTDPNLCFNWPIPVPLNLAFPLGNPSRDPNPGTRVDDLWHAAVNGRGQYFSAADPDAVLAGLTAVLKAIGAQSGAGTGATTATQDPVPGNNLTYRAGFRTVEWTGSIRAQPLYVGDDVSLEGTIAGADAWSAQEKLDSQAANACDNRNIYLLRAGATNNMVPFTWNTYACDALNVPTGSPSTGLNATEQNYFTSTGPAYVTPFSMISWSQFVEMTDGTNSTYDQRALAQGANLVNFLRGQKGMKDFVSGSDTKLFRNRLHILGDIVGSQPRYVPAPNSQFTDTGYAGFKAIPAIANRGPMLYVGANDGMLHAFHAGADSPPGGFEAWAVIPSTVLPNLYRLADTGYSDGHSFYVDATPSAGDVYDKYPTTPVTCNGASADDAKSCWKTIVVSGLGAGGRGYFAMDVTNPTSPKALWEFKWSNTPYDPSDPSTHGSDSHIGLSFGSPLITKLVDGNWVVLIPSGLNNVNIPTQTGDGRGYLYVLDAITGKIKKKIEMRKHALDVVGSAAVTTSALTGTLTLNGSTAVTGTSTLFASELVQGQTIVVNGQTRVVQSIGDDTHLIVSAAFPASANGTFSANKQTSTGPAGFSYINAYVENYIQDNTTERVYAGDALGNVWRIDLKGLADSSDDVVHLATLRDPNGIPQPITTTPQLMNIGAAKTRTVYVGTGRYLGESDLSDTQRQTVYGISEDLTIHSNSSEYIANDYSVKPKAGLTLRQQLKEVTLTTVYKTDPVTGLQVPDYRTSVTQPCSAAAAAAGIGCSGWYADLPDTGERVNLDMRLVLGSLIVPTNVTNLTACDTGGNSWLNVFDAATGGEVPGSPYKAAKYMPGAVTVGISLIRGRSGRILSVLTKSDDSQEVSPVQTQQGSPQGRRSGWRDLPDR